MSNATEPVLWSLRNDQGIVPDDVPAIGHRRPSDFWFNRFGIDLGDSSVGRERLQCADMDDTLGGIARAFGLLEDYDVSDPFDPSAPLVMNLGVLSGTTFMTGLRTFFHGYSPLKTSLNNAPSAMWTAGSGKFGTKLRYLDVDEVIFTGRAPGPVYLHICAGEDDAGPVMTLRDAGDLVGLRVNEKIQTLYKRHPDAHFAVIGPAGEQYQRVYYAAIALSTTNQLKSGDMKSRFCGRGGFGGVMGSKNLLAIVADVPDPKKLLRPRELKDINQIVARGEGSQRFRDARKANGLGGTWVNVAALNPLHALPEMNFVPTGTDVSAPLHRAAVEEGSFIVKDEACHGCGIACHKNLYDETDDGKPGKFRAKFDYEPLTLLSSNIGIFDADQACDLVGLVDDMGMDSISCGVTLSYACEYNRRHGDAGTASAVPGYIQYGDFDGPMRGVREIARGELVALGRGTKRLSEQLGEPQYAMHCKGVELPAYLAQTNPGYPWALAGGHMSMRTYLLLVTERETGMDYWVDAITQRGPLFMRDDMIGICKFAGMTTDQMAAAITMITGLAITEQDLDAAIMRTYLRGWKLEKKQGFTRDDYRLPGEVHAEYPQIDLPHFNTAEFFEELQGKVCDHFDKMLESEEL